jgi:glycosyltransferase involved in cell wall biosynthesis
MISVLMPTYARPEFLTEAIEGFLRQTYTDSELVILNDWRGHTIHFDHPRVRIFNSVEPRRKTLGEVRNLLFSMAKGDIVTDWDDDDIYLPRHLEHALSLMPLYRGGNVCKQRWQWKWSVKTNKGFRITPAGYMHTVLMKREARIKIGGYAHQSRHSDKEILMRLLKGGHLSGPSAMHYEPTFIQRLGTGREHVSGLGNEGESDESRHARVDREAKALGITGMVLIEPRWNADYEKMSRDSYDAVLKTGWGK